MIERHADVGAYFHERVASALDRRRLDVREPTVFYLVNLLARSVTGPEGGMHQPLVYRLAEALEAPDPGTRFRRFRQMGDAALYACGFFPDHFDRRGISRGYVVAMGGRAYERARDLASWAPGVADADLSQVYDELAGRFEEVAGVLDDVREDSALRTPQDIVRLYDRWRRTRSPLLAERLRQEGVHPQAGDETLH